jgi:hypothetical protein
MKRDEHERRASKLYAEVRDARLQVAGARRDREADPERFARLVNRFQRARDAYNTFVEEYSHDAYTSTLDQVLAGG